MEVLQAVPSDAKQSRQDRVGMYFLIEFDWLFLEDVKIISTFWIVLDGCHLKWARPKSERGRRERGSLVRREKS